MERYQGKPLPKQPPQPKSAKFADSQPKRTLSILDAMADPNLFGQHFKSKVDWGPWKAFLSTMFGIPLTPSQLELFQRCTGRTDPDPDGHSEVYVVAGRGAGKSFVALSLTAVFLACFRDWRPLLGPGERGTIMVIAQDRAQARVCFRFIYGLLSAAPILRASIESKTQERIDLNNRITIEVHAARAAVRAPDIPFGLSVLGRRGSPCTLGAISRVARACHRSFRSNSNPDGCLSRPLPGSQNENGAVPRIFFKRFQVPAWVFLLYWGALQLLSLVFGSGGEDNVAYAVHVGGFAVRGAGRNGLEGLISICRGTPFRVHADSLARSKRRAGRQTTYMSAIRFSAMRYNRSLPSKR